MGRACTYQHLTSSDSYDPFKNYCGVTSISAPSTYLHAISSQEVSIKSESTPELLSPNGSQSAAYKLYNEPQILDPTCQGFLYHYDNEVSKYSLVKLPSIMPAHLSDIS